MFSNMQEDAEEHVTDEEYDEGRAKSHMMIDQGQDDYVTLDTITSVTPERRRKANLGNYENVWQSVLRMEVDASTIGERRDEEEETDDHGAAETRRLVDAGVCIPKAWSQVVQEKEYKLNWSGSAGHRIGLHQQVALTQFAKNPPDEPYYLKVTSKKKKHDYSTSLQLNLQTNEIHIV